jgi:hypothetical protein
MWAGGGKAGQGVRMDQAGSIKHWKTKVIDVLWWGRVLVAGEWLKMIQKSENEGKGAGLVHNMNGDIWMGEKVGGECILIYKSG